MEGGGLIMRRTARVKQQAQMLAVGVALLALILCSLFFILQGTRPSGAKMMEKALASTGAATKL